VLRDIEGLTIDQTVEVVNVSQTAVKDGYCEFGCSFAKI
jgi:hypothetical protein